MKHWLRRCAGISDRPIAKTVFLFAGLLLVMSSDSVAVAADTIQRIEADSSTGIAAAVVVHDAPLVHTRQFLPSGNAAQLASMSAKVQLADVVGQLKKSIGDAKASQIVKINLYAASDEVASQILSALPSHFEEGQQPATSLVVTSLPMPEALVAVDGIASASAAAADSVSLAADRATLPRGSRIYISGQAEQSESLAEATQATLQSLHRTLEFLGRTDGDIVQLKAFVQPMSDANLVRAEVDKFFAGKPVPPLILVEWKSSKTTPIEIELIAAGGKPASEAPSMEFLTPPGMTASPVYCRVCRISHPTTIYVSGLFSKHDRGANPDSTVNGEIEVKDQFAQLDRILKLTGSDFKHLAKATYYVSTDSASVSLNKLRPGYYDPQRPPAASKAIVSSVGFKDLGLTIDMIAVPNSAPAAPMP